MVCFKRLFTHTHKTCIFANCCKVLAGNAGRPAELAALGVGAMQERGEGGARLLLGAVWCARGNRSECHLMERLNHCQPGGQRSVSGREAAAGPCKASLEGVGKAKGMICKGKWRTKACPPKGIFWFSVEFTVLLPSYKRGKGVTVKLKSRQGFENFILIVVRTENGTTWIHSIRNDCKWERDWHKGNPLQP